MSARSSSSIAARSGGDSAVDRTVATIRSRCEHLRHTISKLEHSLAWNPTITWPELLGQYLVISSQLEVMSEEIQPMLEHFVCVPTKPLHNPSDVPFLLRTRNDPKVDEKESEIAAEIKTEIATNQETGSFIEKLDRYNDFCERIDDVYKEESEAFLKSIKVDHASIKQATKPTTESMFRLRELGPRSQ